jgi:hypothetical protein
MNRLLPLILTFFITINFANAISINPMRIELEITPNAIHVDKININNSGSQKAKVNIEISSKKGEKINWLTSDLNEFFLEKDESIDLIYKIKSPKGFIGEKIAYIYVTSIAKDSSISTRMGIPVYLMGINKKVVNTKIKDFKISLESGFVKTQAIFVTKGNVHTRPIAKMKLIDKETGKTVVDTNNNSDFIVANEWPVYPNKSRSIDMIHEGLALEKGKTYIIELKIDYLYLFNKYNNETKKYEVTL